VLFLDQGIDMARFSTDLVLWNLPWGLRLTFSYMRADGRISPRIVFTFDARTLIPEQRMQIAQLNVWLSFQNEVLAMGWVREVGRELDSSDQSLTFVVPITHPAIHFVLEHLRDHEIQLTLQFSGAMFARDDRPLAQWQGGTPGMQPGKWFLAPIRDTNLVVNIPRSDWVKYVLEPVGFGNYVLMEMPVPSVPDRERWRTALEHLTQAGEQFALGNDPGVFQYCRAAFESLEGFPKNIFAAVEDEEKRKSVDTLLKESQHYFHSGRHISETGGMFPVDHRDAEFALALARFFMAYIAKLLTRP
jgi:hypothetical protein